MSQPGYADPGQVNVQYSGQPGYAGQGYAGPPVTQQPMTSQQTTVIVQGGGAGAPMGVNIGRDWSSRLCGCFEDCTSCACSFFCGCCYLMHLYSRAGENCCAPMCIQTSLLTLRTKVKARHGIKGGICEDFCIGCFCYQCQLAQLAREMNTIEANGQAI